MKNDYPNPKIQENDDEIDLMQLFSILFYHKYTIAFSVLVGLFLGVLYAFSASPIYRADALLQVDEKRGSTLSVLFDADTLLGGSQGGLETEIELLRSRQIIGQTINSLHLNTQVSANDFPIFGHLMRTISGVADPVLTLKQFNIPDALMNQDFELRYQGANQYSLLTPDGQSYSGEVGKPLAFDGGGVLEIAHLEAENGQDFTLNQSPFLSVVDDFNTRLSVSSKGKKTSLLTVALTGKDPQKIQKILNTLLAHYLAFDKEQQARNATNGLAFITAELPRLNATLTAAENKLNRYRKEKGSLDLSVQSEDIVKNLTNLEMQIVALKTQRAGLAEIYTSEHPAYREVNEKLAALQKSKQEIEGQIAALPDVQQDVIRLNREVQINQAIYIQLLNKQQELNLVKAGSIGNAQIIDAAMTAEKPIKPKKKIIVLIAGFLAGFLAIGFVLLREMLVAGIQDSQDLENAGIAVLAEIPANQQERLKKRHAPIRLFRRMRNCFVNRIDADRTELLSVSQPTSATVEAIRALRTGLLFALNSARNQVLMITGPTPGVGKTFISANLAVVMAQVDKKVLLIDADMRKGLVHDAFRARADQGLTEVLSGKMSADQAIQRTQVEGLSLMSRGRLAANSTELLTSASFARLLAWAQNEYDYVILDTPPILLVSDALLIGRMVGSGVLVSGFGLSKLKEVETAMTRLKQAQVPMEGTVINNVTITAKNHSSYGAYYGEYHQE